MYYDILILAHNFPSTSPPSALEKCPLGLNRVNTALNKPKSPQQDKKHRHHLNCFHAAFSLFGKLFFPATLTTAGWGQRSRPVGKEPNADCSRV